MSCSHFYFISFHVIALNFLHFDLVYIIRYKHVYNQAVIINIFESIKQMKVQLWLLVVILSMVSLINCLTTAEFKAMIKKMDKLKLEELLDVLDYLDLNVNQRPTLYAFYDQQIKLLINRHLQEQKPTPLVPVPAPKEKIFFGSTSIKTIYSDLHFYFDVDLKHLNLTKTPVVSTYLTSEKNNHHWVAVGTTSIYFLTNSKFRVYIRSVQVNENIFLSASQQGFTLNYIIFSQD